MNLPDTKGSRLLLVDDVPENIGVLIGLLGDAGYHIHVATGGIEAVEVAADVHPDLILLDVMMPEVDGFEACRRLKANPETASIPVIFLTARTDTEAITTGFEVGGADFVAKPFNSEELMARVRNHLERSALSLTVEELRAQSGSIDEQIRVLMIDDQPTMGEAVRRLLADEEDIEFLHIADASETRRVIEDVRPSVLLLDLVMPGIDGFDLLADLRAHATTTQLPIIILSSAEEGNRKSQAFASGASDYLVKVPDQLELVARIRHHAASHIHMLQRNQAHAELKKSQVALERSSAFIRQVFGRYVSDSVVDTLLDDPEHLNMGGELRIVTVLMSDLRGFTTLSEQLEAGQVVAVINRYLSSMTDIILEYGGTIEEFMGDGIKATFGSVEGDEKHAEKAVACALAMQQAMDGVNAANLGDRLPEVEMGIGLHTGNAVVGNIGSSKRAKYGVFGRHVNLAARVESFTVGGQILLSEFTRNEVTAELFLGSSREIAPKGVQQPITVFEVAGIGTPYNLQLSTAEGRPPELPQPLRLQLRVLAEKDAGGQEHDGELYAIGRRRAGLRTAAPVRR